MQTKRSILEVLIEIVLLVFNAMRYFIYIAHYRLPKRVFCVLEVNPMRFVILRKFGQSHVLVIKSWVIPPHILNKYNCRLKEHSLLSWQ
jgi:hypothetical protein